MLKQVQQDGLVVAARCHANGHAADLLDVRARLNYRCYTMTNDDLDELARLHSAATPGPWYVGRFDDEHFMTAISIEAAMAGEAGLGPSEVIAATLIQQPRYVAPSDNRYIENANVIAAMRNMLPELIRLAALGLSASGKT